jgi:hypothetical protein
MLRKDLEEQGFCGFIPINHLLNTNFEGLPVNPGVYAVLRIDDQPVRFMHPSMASHQHKGKDPTVSIDVLKAKWVNCTQVLYFGKSVDLKRRIKEYINFGYNIPDLAHYGGRFLWQVEGYENFLIAWLESKDQDPKSLEDAWKNKFKEQFGVFPFANIK